MTTPIRTTDPDAIERLQEKREALEKLQETMKAANRIFKSTKMHHDVKIAELAKLGISEADAEARLSPRWGEPGFPGWELRNNNAEIKRVIDRIAKCERAAKFESSEETNEDGVTIEWDAEEGRVRLRFPETRVSHSMYQTLRRSGFVYARTLGAFSRMWTNNDAKYRVQNVLAAYHKEQAAKANA
jgi:hypothetical protein